MVVTLAITSKPYRKIRISVKDWLERKFEQVLTAPWPDVRVNCPDCNDQKGRLYIATEDGPDEKKGDGWCHNEQKSKPFFFLYRNLENITDGEADEQLYSDNPEPLYGKVEEALAQWEQEQNKVEVMEVAKPVVWPDDYVSLFGLTTQEWAKKVPQYMVNRRLDQAMCNKYLLGFCVGSKRFAGRMIVPIYQAGQLVGFQGRGMHDGIRPKYMFSEGMKAGDFLFNLDHVPVECDEVILVEGVFDVWGVIRCGYPNVVCSFGKHLTNKGVKTLVKRFKSVLIFWDMDAKEEICNLASNLEGMVQVRTSFLDGKDPDEAEVVDVQNAILKAQQYDKMFRFESLRNIICNG
jgi:5S rRNA maturation endonuclease (ribonuclease M5)